MATSIKLNDTLQFCENSSDNVVELNSTTSKIKFKTNEIVDSFAIILDEHNKIWNFKNPEIVLRTSIKSYNDFEKIVLVKDTIDNIFSKKNITPKIVLYITYLFSNGYERNLGEFASHEIKSMVKLISKLDFYKVYIYEPYDINYINSCLDIDLFPNKKWNKINMLYDFIDIIKSYDSSTTGIVFVDKRMYHENFPLLNILYANYQIPCPECTYANNFNEHASLNNSFSNKVKNYIIIDRACYTGNTIYKIVKDIKKFNPDSIIDIIVAHGTFKYDTNSSKFDYLKSNIRYFYCSDSLYEKNYNTTLVVSTFWNKVKIINSKY